VRQSPAAVTSEMVAAYSGMVEAHAARFTRLPLMENDYDDFVQHGLISVWESLKDGEYPSNLVVTNAMKDWARVRRRQLAHMPSEEEGWLPLESLDVLEELAA
jgi:DNA-directed RNA polymerase specialized sigma24 family protein